MTPPPEESPGDDPRIPAPAVVSLGHSNRSREAFLDLLEAAAVRGARHVALGHHADDVVETFLLSLLYTGRGEIMPPERDYFRGAVRLIRPLYEVRKDELERVARLAGAPVQAARCARERDSRRASVRSMLDVLGRDQRRVRRQLYWAAVRQLEGGSDGGMMRQKTTGTSRGTTASGRST